MEDCVHVKQVKLAADRSFLNPRNWSCSECGTTESVWVRDYIANSSSVTCSPFFFAAFGVRV